MTEYGNESQKQLIVTIGCADYALPVENVECILSLRRNAVCSVPFDLHNRVRGIFNYQGSIVSLANCAALTTFADKNGDETLTAVILSDSGKRFAILVDRANVVADGETDIPAALLNVHALYTGEAADGD